MIHWELMRFRVTAKPEQPPTAEPPGAHALTFK